MQRAHPADADQSTVIRPLAASFRHPRAHRRNQAGKRKGRRRTEKSPPREVKMIDMESLLVVNPSVGDEGSAPLASAPRLLHTSL